MPRTWHASWRSKCTKKSIKNGVNRRVNAEIANQARSTSAAAVLELHRAGGTTLDVHALPPVIRTFMEARKANPELSLGPRGGAQPRVQVRDVPRAAARLQELVEDAEREVGYRSPTPAMPFFGV